MITRLEAQMLKQAAANRGVRWAYVKERGLFLNGSSYETMRSAEDYLETLTRKDLPQGATS